MNAKPLRNESLLTAVRLVAALAFCVQFLVLIRFSHSDHFVDQGGDMAFYSNWALRIADGHLSDGKAFYGLPGYAYVLGALFLVLGYDPFTVGLIQAGLFSLVAVLIYKIAEQAFSGADARSRGTARAAGWLAALGWTFFVPAQTFSVVLMPTVWLVAAYWACIWVLMRMGKTRRLLPWLLIGLAMGLVSMMVATILMLTPMVLVAIWQSVAPGEPWKSRLKQLVVAAGCFAAGVFAGSAPASLHNHLIAHEPVMLSAHSGINFFIGNNSTSTGYPKMPPGIRASQEGLLKDSLTLAEKASGRPLSRAEVSAYWSQQAHGYIHGHPGEWLGLMGRKFANFWNTYQYDDLSIIALLRDGGVVGPGLGFGLVAALGAAGMVVATRRSAGGRWIAGGVLLHLLALMPVFITERYRLAAVPGLLLLGAWWAVQLWEQLVLRRWLAAGALSSAAVASAWLVSVPRADYSLWSLDHYRAGIYATGAEKLDKAQRELEIAERYSPDNADVKFALGNLWLARKDRPKAKAFYYRALALEPEHDGVLNNAGVLALDEKRWRLAERFFVKALRIEPNDAKRHYLLARARLGGGDIAGARQAIAAALRLRPSQPEFLKFQDELNAPSPAPAQP